MNFKKLVVANLVGIAIAAGAVDAAGAAKPRPIGTINSYSASCKAMYDRWHNLDSVPVSELTPDQQTEKRELLKLYNLAGCKSKAGSIVSIYTTFL